MTSTALAPERLSSADERVLAWLGALETALTQGDSSADGKVKLKSGVTVTAITETGWAAKRISQEVADAVGKCWGLGSGTTKDPGPLEGELRNIWKPTRYEALWFHGGNLHQSRHYSQVLAMQIKARMEGVATPVYGQPEVHHKG